MDTGGLISLGIGIAAILALTAAVFGAGALVDRIKNGKPPTR